MCEDKKNQTSDETIDELVLQDDRESVIIALNAALERDLNQLFDEREAA
jgi:hypothetical protein